METDTAKILNEEQKRDFYRDGYVRVGSVMDRATAWRWNLKCFNPSYKPRQWVDEVSELTKSIAFQLLREDAYDGNMTDPGWKIRNPGWNWGHSVSPAGAHIDGFNSLTGHWFPLGLVCFYYLSDTSKEGGATAVWKGSHSKVFKLFRDTPQTVLAPKVKREDFAEIAETCELELLDGKAGDMFLWSGLTLHAVTNSAGPESRIGLSQFLNLKSYPRSSSFDKKLWRR